VLGRKAMSSLVLVAEPLNANVNYLTSGEQKKRLPFSDPVKDVMLSGIAKACFLRGWPPMPWGLLKKTAGYP
jgi:hypothetical protein